jgi:hypothetical protein
MALWYLTPIPRYFQPLRENGIVVYMAAMHQCMTEYLETGSEQEGLKKINVLRSS